MRARGRDRLLEVDQLGVETIELVSLAGDVCPLLGEQRSEIPVDFAVFNAQPGDPTRILRPKAKASQADDDSQSRQVLIGELPIAVRLSGSGGDDPGRLIPANR